MKAFIVQRGYTYISIRIMVHIIPSPLSHGSIIGLIRRLSYVGYAVIKALNPHNRCVT